MISYEQALKIIEQKALHLNLEVEVVSLLNCMGRILAGDLHSSENIPAADNSAMDGFAIQAQDTIGASRENPIEIKIMATLAAGAELGNVEFRSKQGLEIMTGAILPDSKLNAVVRIEDVEVKGDTIVLRQEVPELSHIRKAGTDFRQGQKVAKKGTLLQEQHVLALAALGITEVKVYRKFKVAVISTGTEIVDCSMQNLKLNQVRNSSAPYLKVFLEKHHCQVDLLGLIKDEVKDFSLLLKNALKEKYDLILTTGAVSAGKWDFVTTALPDFNFQVLFHKVAIRPGKPILFAESKSQKTFLFGLPGNPISTAVGAQFFVLPFITRKLSLPVVEEFVELSEAVKKPADLECFYKAKRIRSVLGDRVQVLSGQMSYMIHSFLDSDCWAQLPAVGQEVSAATLVKTTIMK